MLLFFEHNASCHIEVWVRIPLPDPITEGAHEIATRLCPDCPVCKEPMYFEGFSLDGDESKGS